MLQQRHLGAYRARYEIIFALMKYVSGAFCIISRASFSNDGKYLELCCMTDQFIYPFNVNFIFKKSKQ